MSNYAFFFSHSFLLLLVVKWFQRSKIINFLRGGDFYLKAYWKFNVNGDIRWAFVQHRLP